MSKGIHVPGLPTPLALHKWYCEGQYPTGLPEWSHLSDDEKTAMAASDHVLRDGVQHARTLSPDAAAYAKKYHHEVEEWGDPDRRGGHRVRAAFGLVDIPATVDTAFRCKACGTYLRRREVES